MIKVLYATVLVLFFLLIFLNHKKEEYMGYGNVFSVHSNPNPNCILNNDCHAGSYYRSQQYSDMEDPLDNRLTRERKHVVDNCVRSLEGSMLFNNCNKLYKK